MDKIDAINIAKRFKSHIQKEMDIEKVFLFGSYSRGTARKHSDIDIAVLFKEPFDDDYNILVKLWKMRCDIDVRIEPVIIYKENDITMFSEFIIKTGIEIN